MHDFPFPFNKLLVERKRVLEKGVDFRDRRERPEHFLRIAPALVGVPGLNVGRHGFKNLPFFAVVKGVHFTSVVEEEGRVFIKLFFIPIPVFILF